MRSTVDSSAGAAHQQGICARQAGAPQHSRPTRKFAWFLGALLALNAVADPLPSPQALALREREAALSKQLKASPFGQPLVIESKEASGRTSGHVYADVAHPYARIRASLVQPGQWCEVLILHLNVKRCRAEDSRIALHLGRKYAQPIEQAYRLQFSHAVPANTEDYLNVRMEAPSGPMGTRDYVIELEATPLPSGRTFLHFGYTVGHGSLANFAMQAYLNTLGASKIGFSTADTGEGAQPVRGMRGATERNAMRYYLAITAYLDSIQQPENERVPRRLQAWFDATERYPAQLHELERDEYLAMKHDEIAQ